jgi:RNA polymerase sigma-70 factor, ECF subfamily
MANDSAPTGFDAARLVKEHQAGVWRYLRVLGCDANEAEDLTQETFLAVLTKPFHDHNHSATAAYLRTVARNLLVTSRRKTARGPIVGAGAAAGERQTIELAEADAAWRRWAAHDEGEDLLAALRHCLEGLTARARQAIDLRYGAQASRSAIASALNLSEDGAKNLLQRAKQQLRQCVERHVKGDREQPTIENAIGQDVPGQHGGKHQGEQDRGQTL